MNQQLIIDSQDAIAEYMAEQLIIESGMEPNKAFSVLISSDTYALLRDPESYMYTKSPEYVWSLLQAELAGDRETWMAVF